MKKTSYVELYLPWVLRLSGLTYAQLKGKWPATFWLSLPQPGLSEYYSIPNRPWQEVLLSFGIFIKKSGQGLV